MSEQPSQTSEPWIWETVEKEGSVTEHTLTGPTVLCRYWHDGPPDADARLIAAAPETKDQLAELVAAAEPISAVAERIPDGINDYTVFLRFPLHDRGLDTEVTAGTLRRLAAAVAATKAKGE